MCGQFTDDKPRNTFYLGLKFRVNRKQSYKGNILYYAYTCEVLLYDVVTYFLGRGLVVCHCTVLKMMVSSLS
jgi:hypothetical protein